MEDAERQKEEAERKRRKAEIKQALERTAALRAAVKAVAEHYRSLPREERA